MTTTSRRTRADRALPRPRADRAAGANAVGRPASTTHDEIERAAFDLFARNGFEGTSVDDIAAAVGVGRRTFFRYYPTKADVVWGDFDGQLEHLRAWFDACPADVPLMDAVRLATLDFNRVEPGQLAAHRRRMGLILGVPTLVAHSTLRLAAWRDVVAAFAAARLGTRADALVPTALGHAALGASLAAYETWLADPRADLAALIDASYRALASGFADAGAAS